MSDRQYYESCKRENESAILELRKQLVRTKNPEEIANIEMKISFYEQDNNLLSSGFSFEG